MKNRIPMVTGRARLRLLVLSIAAVLCVVSVILAAASSSFVAYAVAYDGEVVATVSSRADLDSAIVEADTLAAAILGEEHPVTSNLSVTTVLSSGGDTTDSLTDALLVNVEGIVYRPTLTVNGKIVAAAESEEIISAVLSDILIRYTNENTVSAEFAEEIEIASTYVSHELLTDAETLTELLDPQNGLLTVVTKEATESIELIPYAEVITYDQDAWSDESWITREGTEGQRLNITTTVLENGVPVTSYLSRTEIISEPVDQQITVGAIPGSRTDSTGTYIWPTTGLITSNFGYRDLSVASSNHRGVDIGNSVGTDVWAADGGTVIYAQDTKGNYGIFIEIQHDDGTVTCYAHLSKILVEVGEKVYQGQLIAKMGKTGRVTGPHLHFEIRPDGTNPVNPTKYLSGKPDRN